jgi:hypothetical protein
VRPSTAASGFFTIDLQTDAPPPTRKKSSTKPALEGTFYTRAINLVTASSDYDRKGVLVWLPRFLRVRPPACGTTRGRGADHALGTFAPPSPGHFCIDRRRGCDSGATADHVSVSVVVSVGRDADPKASPDHAS